ncbi:hypothetical protein E8E13_000680 [Curvularia kusanoi]|uniref:Uncharacterized protein n=1 Tax=Curvularia kusanoi TaxID=90978 RepID=A0A9P4T476_CURKU|nr:hypothetical protein E8E13_000680 [Curvularia kusanoi]
MWRSPEAQTGRGMSKASDIYSLGLVFIFTFGGGEMLLLHDYKEMIAHGITAEQEILTRHFAYFGLANDRLLKQVGDEEWCQALRSASAIARLEVEANPGIKFECWAEDLGTDAINLISAMANPDPISIIGGGS